MLTSLPAESEHLSLQSATASRLGKSNKACENSLTFKVERIEGHENHKKDE
jgi:hypothetical protein